MIFFDKKYDAKILQQTGNAIVDDDLLLEERVQLKLYAL